jgi:hypothetical protein
VAGTGRTRRVLRTLNREGSLTPSQLAAREGVHRVSMSHRLAKLRMARKVIQNGHLYTITPRGRESIGLVPFPHPGTHLDERKGDVAAARSRRPSPGPRAAPRKPGIRRQLFDQMQEAHLRAARSARSTPREPSAEEPMLRWIAAPPSLPPSPAGRRHFGVQSEPSELGGVPVGSGLWLMPDGSYVLGQT